MQPYNQPTASPTPKVAAVGASGIVLTIVVLVASLLGVSLPTDVQNNIGALVTGVVALTSIVHFAVGYFTKDKKATGSLGATNV